MVTVPKNPKQRGEWVELLFMAQAARRGLLVSKPMGDSTRYDVIVQPPGEQERLWRVQVKSTYSKSRFAGSHICEVHSMRYKCGVLARKRSYTPEEVDFVAAYVIPEDSWFIVPIRAVPKHNLALPGRGALARSRYGQYHEAWHLLGAKEKRGITIRASADLMAVLVDMLRERVRAEE